MSTLWKKHFDKENFIELGRGTFHTYEKGDSGPVILCLHGAGYSGLTWALMTSELTTLIDCRIVALDLRGHGKTTTSNDEDLSLHTLAEDVVEVANTLSEDSIAIVGHSLGGAVAVEASISLKNLSSLCVIDTVEGTAISALPYMQTLLRERPSHFASVHHAIQWYIDKRVTSNVKAAEVSMPGQIINVKTGMLASDEDDISPPPEYRRTSLHMSKIEEEAIPQESYVAPNYTWRVDLRKTEPHWKGWFAGLSKKFLDVQLPKVLILTDISGLDTALTVGQMQGKFQLKVIQKCGHVIHEDLPNDVSKVISEYLVKLNIANKRI